MDFNAVFTVSFNDERYIWRYQFHPPHLINVATIPCETQNNENVRVLRVILNINQSINRYYNGILPKKIASNVSYMLHRNGPVDHKIRGVVQQCVYETKICDIYDLQKRLM